MTTPMMTRSQFLGSLGVGFALFACKASDDPGDDSSEPSDDDEPADDDDADDDDDAMATPDASTPDSPAMACAAPMSMIGGNHGHEIVVPLDDVLDRQEKTYDIMGDSMHPHQVTVTSAMFQMIEAGQTVTITSSTNAAHSHQVTITC
jgi:hypothetical protein